VAALVLASALSTAAMAGTGGSRAAVYTQTNDPGGNAVQRFTRAADGSLDAAGTFATGGAGLATLGGRQGAVSLSGDGRSLYAVNAGSDTVSVFRLGHRGPRLAGTVASRGVAPTSIAEDHGRVYVLNSGGTPNVVAFRRWFDGRLVPTPGGARDLAPGAQGAAQVSVTPDGHSLVVSERLANRLETLPLDRFGRPGAPVVTPSSGAAPFGFGITSRGTIVVSEAGARAPSPRTAPAPTARFARSPRPWASATARRAGSPCRRPAASPTPATRPGASAASRSIVTERSARSPRRHWSPRRATSRSTRAAGSSTP
jgi:DNA-binding beta-propeller fold protein YncE